MGGIAKGTSDELQATVAVPSGTAAGRNAILTATAKASDASAPPAADAAIKITAKPSSALAVAVTDAHPGIQFAVDRLGDRGHAAPGHTAHRPADHHAGSDAR